MIFLVINPELPFISEKQIQDNNDEYKMVQYAVVTHICLNIPSLTLSVQKLKCWTRWRQFERFASVKDGKVQRFGGAWQDIPEETE